MPFQIDRPVRGFAMDFRPAVWTSRTLVFTGNQIKPPELRIGHDLFPQRSGPGRDYLNYGLHSTSQVQQEISLFAMLLSISRMIKRGPLTSAKGAHPLQSLGTAPAFSKTEAISAESATHLVESIESRFQRFPCGPSITRGGAPG